MVQLLVTVLSIEKTKRKSGDNLDHLAASIRCQKGEHAFAEMYDLFGDYLDDLDLEPKAEEIAVMYGVIADPLSPMPSGPTVVKPMPKSKLFFHLAQKGLTIGSEAKLRKGRGFSIMSAAD